MNSMQAVGRWRGVTAQQALLTLVIALALSVLAGMVEMAADARILRTETQQQTHRMLNLISGPAAEAAYQLNVDLAEQLVNGVYSDGVSRAVIIDDFGRVMASRDRTEHADEQGLSQRILMRLFGDILHYRRELIHDLGGNAPAQYVGEMELSLDLNIIGKSFIDRGKIIFLLSLTKALGIAFLVVVGFHLLITRPLLRVHDALSYIDPAQPAVWPRPDLPRHRNDELGNLVARLDHLMAEFQNGLDQRDQLQEISAVDGLTGIFNRRHFDHVLDNQWALSKRRQTPISLIFMDIDQFKPFNDNYGHVSGDDCLRQVAKAIDAAVPRTGDLVARYGGEEFVCLLSDTNLEGALCVARKIQESVLALDIRHEFSEASARVSLSMGLASLTPAPDVSSDALLEQADQRLYKAKTLGRNRIVWNDHTP